MIRQKDPVHLSNSRLERIFQERRAYQIVFLPLETFQIAHRFADCIPCGVGVVQDVSTNGYRSARLDVKRLARETVVVAIELRAHEKTVRLPSHGIFSCLVRNIETQFVRTPE